MATLAAVLLFLALLSVLSFFYQQLRQTEETVATRMAAFVGGEGQASLREQELRQPLYYRLVKPLLTRLGAAGKHYLPASRAQVLERKLLVAGNPGGLTAAEFLVVKYLAGICLGVAWLLFSRLTQVALFQFLLFLVGIMLAGFLLPDFYIRKRAQARQEAVRQALPDVLDLLTVSIEAGLGLDGAILKVVEKMKGVLPGEFKQVLQEVKVGKPRREALKDMAFRLDVDDLSTFIGAVLMAEQMGVQLANVMRLQAQEIRSKRRQQAEEQAMKAPVKMLIPLVFFIFPAIFVVLLGPAVLKIFGIFRAGL
ncbi:MAG: type II secretion system F family protein [Thermoanaerobacteraceae bacterium]|nr:type II secretion system F family protein [Thermoanaerobacteraceae bacterium]